MLASLEVRNFRRFLAGQTASQAGMWLHFVGLAWLVDDIAGSGTAIGWITVALFGPLLVLGPWAGARAARVNKHRLLVAMQLLISAATAALGLVVLAGCGTVSLISALTLAYGLFYAVETPVRRSFVAEVVDDDGLANAVSLYNSVSAIGRVLGPVLAGTLIASAGVGWCFLINALGHLAALAGLMLMRRDQLRTTEASPEPVTAAAGIRYAWRVPELRIALLLTGIVATLAFNHQVLVPLLAHQAFGGGIGTFTLIYAGISAGSVAGALAVTGRREPSLHFLVGATAAFAVANALIAASPNLLCAVLAAFCTGATAVLFVTTSTMLLQRRCADVMRGRVMALAAMVLLGGIPIGGPLIGWIADLAGPRVAVAVGSIVSLLACAVVLRHLCNTSAPGTEVSPSAPAGTNAPRRRCRAPQSRSAVRVRRRTGLQRAP